MNEKYSSIYSFTDSFTATPFVCQKETNVSIMILIFFKADHDINLYKDKITWKGNFAYI
jgi:hypothetical protein